MREAKIESKGRGRDLLLAVCATCTLWLIVQNSLLLALGWIVPLRREAPPRAQVQSVEIRHDR
jgi:hypothetical protein